MHVSCLLPSSLDLCQGITMFKGRFFEWIKFHFHATLQGHNLNDIEENKIPN